MGRFQEAHIAEVKLQRKQQDRSHKVLLKKVASQLGLDNVDDGWDDISALLFPGLTEKAAQPSVMKSVTMSGLLNALDGAAAAEGQLLIMTTNHREHLSSAFIRPGRIDSCFEIGYATKRSAEQTFKRIFGLDPQRKHHTEAIDRFAEAFKT